MHHVHHFTLASNRHLEVAHATRSNERSLQQNTACKSQSHDGCFHTTTDQRSEFECQSEIAQIDGQQRQILERIRALAEERERLEQVLENLKTTDTDEDSQESSDEE